MSKFKVVSSTNRDVTVGRIHIVVFPHPIYWINIYSIPIPISVQVYVIWISAYFSNIYEYSRILVDIYNKIK